MMHERSVVLNGAARQGRPKRSMASLPCSENLAVRGLRVASALVHLLLSGEERELQAVRQSEPPEDVREMPFHRVFAERELLRDLLVRPAGCDRRDDLLLPWRDVRLARLPLRGVPQQAPGSLADHEEVGFSFEKALHALSIDSPVVSDEDTDRLS